LLIGDDSSIVEPTFTVTVGQADNFERFSEGVSDAGDEFARGTLDLVNLGEHLRDVTTTVVVNRKAYTATEHHIDVVLSGNDTINGGDGNDLVVGDDFVTRTATVTVVAGGTPERYGHDDDWQDLDWKDCSLTDWFDHQNWFAHDWHEHEHDAHWEIAGLHIGADTIGGGKGDDLVWGDNLAIVETSVLRGAGISNTDWSSVSHDVDDGIERFATLTDSADYWLALQGHHHYSDDDDPWCFDNGDTISGGDGNDILYGQACKDKITGDAGDDWLIGGDGHDDSLNGGTGSNKVSNGNDSSSSLRSAVKARLINWTDTFKSFGVPFSPFAGLKPDTSKPKPSSFEFLELDD